MKTAILISILGIFAFLARIAFAFPVVSQQGSFITLLNDSSTGTQLNTLTTLTSANPAKAVVAPISTTSGVLGITVSGAGTVNAALIQTSGSTNCIFDGATTSGDYVNVSSSTPGYCHDAGSSPGASTVAVVTSTNSMAGTYTVIILPSLSSSATPINLAPAQTGAYNGQGFAFNNLGGIGSSGPTSITGNGGNTSTTITNAISRVNLGGALDVQAMTGTDFCAQFNNAITYAQTNNIQKIFAEPGVYTSIPTECSIPSYTPMNGGVLDIDMAGVVLSFTGLTTEFNVIYATNWNHVVIHGLKIDDRGNPTVTTGLNVSGAFQFTCDDCSVIADGGTTASGYTTVHIGNSFGGNDSTFTQSAQFQNGLFVGAGTAGCTITADSAFQTTFESNKISSGQYAVCLKTDPATSGFSARMPVFPLFVNNDIESFTSGCFYLNPGANATSTFWNGGNFYANRCDANGSGLLENESFFTVGTNYTAGALKATNFMGNNLSGVGQWLNNLSATAFPVASLDDQIVDSNAPSIKGYPGMLIQNGLTVDNLALQAGIGGSTLVSQLGAPTLTVGTLDTPGSTTYCYKGSAVDYLGQVTTSNAHVCTTTGPASLNGSNRIEVTANPTANHPCGYRIYGNQSGSEALMLPTSPPMCGSTTVTMLSTAKGHAKGPVFIDDGTVTPSGSVPTINTTGIFEIADTADDALLLANGGHFNSELGTGTLPTVGTGTVTAGGTDNAMEVTGATSPATVTFTTPFAAKPMCLCGDETSALGACKAVPNSNGQTVVVTTTGTDSFMLLCTGK